MFQINGSLGQFTITLALLDPEVPFIRYSTTLRPVCHFADQSLPRDLYVLDDAFNPMTTEGTVHITQNGPASALAYFSCQKPWSGTVFYFQNLTALNDYFEATKTEPDNIVGARWPEIGVRLPSSDQPLPTEKDIVLSDAFLTLTETVPAEDYALADLFMNELARVYRQIPRPATEYYDWPEAASRTIQSLARSSATHRRIKGHFYLNAYVGSAEKPPESMVQLCVLVPALEYQDWKGTAVTLAGQLQQNIATFYDKKLKTIVRWLPDEPFRMDDPSEEEAYLKMDSWYLFHILMDLGRLAHRGDEEAKTILLKSLEFTIKAAHRFNYEWPVFYDLKTLNVLKRETKPGEKNEQDVPGMYTFVMVSAYELTSDKRYLREAEKSAEQLKSKSFTILYQTNNTIMSALGLVKLWKITGDSYYFDLSRVCVANMVSKLWIWEGRFGHAKDYTTFMGVSCLMDASYVAAYEETESFSTAYWYLQETGESLPASYRLLLAEYMKYLLHRGRFYYPAELPKDDVCAEPKEGFLLPHLTIPVEDLRTGWQQVGQVGQEVYGSAGAFVATAYAYHRHPKMPFTVYTEYPVLEWGYEEKDAPIGRYRIGLGGLPDLSCRLRIIPNRQPLPVVRLYKLAANGNEAYEACTQTDAFQEYEVPGGVWLQVEWENSGPSAG